MNFLKNSALLTSLVIAAYSLSGCGKTEPAPQLTEANHAEGDEHDHDEHAEAGSEHEHEHGEWWCDEHGVPEPECAQCDSKLAAEFQKKGDWCEMHDRPDSQCFICHPEFEAKFAALYEAKYGERPPKPEGEGHDHDEEHTDHAQESSTEG